MRTRMHAVVIVPLFLVLVVCNVAYTTPPPKNTDSRVGDPDATARALKASGSKVEGLTLPDNFEVAHDEQFVEIEAKCKGPVSFLVLSSATKVKYRSPKKGDTTITVGVPPTDCVVSIFCVGYIETTKSFTPWARCDITVRGPPQEKPESPPDPPANPPPTYKGARFHITIVEDAARRDAATRALLTDANVRRTLLAAGHVLRIRDMRNAQTIRLGFTALANKIGGPTLVIQINDGKTGVHPPIGGTPIRLPKTAAAFLSYIKKLQGGD